MLRVLVSLTALLCAAPAQAWQDDAGTPSGHEVPRFVTLKFDAANGRTGPSRAHPVAWRYVRAGLPMEVIAETPNWRRVRDPEGEVTWMHQQVLSGRRSVFTLSETPLHARADAEAPVEAVADEGVVLYLERCRDGWCRVEAQGHRGWAQTETLWGVYSAERGEAGVDSPDRSAALSTNPPRDTALP